MTHSPETAAGPEPRVATGIPRLDSILEGGLLSGSLNVVVGPPGGGKTILANQICFHHAREHGGRSVYVTLLAESHDRMMRHLACLEFFDRALVPESVYYVSGYQPVRDDGMDTLLDLIRKTVQARGATLLVLDGVETLAEVLDVQRFRELIHSLQTIASLMGCTTLLLSKLRVDGHPENTLVDSVLELRDSLVGPRAVRDLTVLKFRGSDSRRGRHLMEITGRGIVVHPRTEVQFAAPAGRAREERIRMQFGIKELDKMLGGGLPSGSATALLGAPGAGKTALGLSFLAEGARQNQHGLYFGFFESPPRLLEKAEALGLDLERWVRKGLVEIVWQPPLEHLIDALAEQILEKIRQEPRPRRRLFIDGMEGFRNAAVYPGRIPIFLSALFNQLRTEDVTTLVSDDLDLFRPEVEIRSPQLANVVESVITLRYVELRSQLYRLVSIMKMRESAYDTSIREFQVTTRGIKVAGSFKSAEAILTGLPRVQPTRGRRR